MITHSYTQLVLETSFPFCFRLHFLGLPGRKRTTNETFVCSFPFMQTAQNPGSETASPGHLKFEVQNGRRLPAPFFYRFRIVFVSFSFECLPWPPATALSVLSFLFRFHCSFLFRFHCSFFVRFRWLAEPTETKNKCSKSKTVETTKNTEISFP